MNTKLKIAFFIYVLNAVFMLGTGLLFVFSQSFLPFHSDVIQTQWQDVDSLSQLLYLGMMRTEGAGFLAVGVAFIFLLLIPFRNLKKWSFWALTTIGIIEYLPTFFANYHVASHSEATPPWLLMLVLIISLLIALVIALSGMKEKTITHITNDNN